MTDSAFFEKAASDDWEPSVLAALRAEPGGLSKPELMDELYLDKAQKRDFSRLLRKLVGRGLIHLQRKRYVFGANIPSVGLLVIEGYNEERELIGILLDSRGREDEEPEAQDDEHEEASDEALDEPEPLRFTVQKPGGKPLIGVKPGDKVLARLQGLDHFDDEAGAIRHRALVIKVLGAPRERQAELFIFRADPEGGTMVPTARSGRAWHAGHKLVSQYHLSDGDLVSSQGKEGQNRSLKVMGSLGQAKEVWRIAALLAGYRDDFSSEVKAEAEAVSTLPLDAETREDWTDLPFVTIDPADARDHDDAVAALMPADGAPSGEIKLLVAIADVAAYVSADGALDKEAVERGNSVYFPGKVIPMLPEQLSNDLCSLKEGELRPVLGVEIRLGPAGETTGYRFCRALIRSRAALAYEQAEAFFTRGKLGEKRAGLAPALSALWSAYQRLAKARDKRQPLDLDLPEYKFDFSPTGELTGVSVPKRLEAHRLIEEMMIRANVAAADYLITRGKAGTMRQGLFRVHAEPDNERFQSFNQSLGAFDLSIKSGGSPSPRDYNFLLSKARKHDNLALVSELVLRSQSQAVYASANIGHFGLNLKRYTHFTSPIRRYADLWVHRAILEVLALDQQKEAQAPTLMTPLEQLDALASAISQAERKAMAAERETKDRLAAILLRGRIGDEFDGLITGISRAGLFIRLKDYGADGIVPMSHLGREKFVHDEAQAAMVGLQSARGWQLGDLVEVRLDEAEPAQGGLKLTLLTQARKLKAVRGRALKAANWRSGAPKHKRRRSR